MSSRENYKSLLRIVITFCLIQSIITGKSRCNPDLCDCSKYQQDNWFSCPANGPTSVTFKIWDSGKLRGMLDPAKYFPLIEAYVTCYTNDQLVFDVLSQIDVESVQQIAYTNCTVPFNSSLAAGMPNLTGLRFQLDHDAVDLHWKSVHFTGMNNLWKIELKTYSPSQLPNTPSELPSLNEVHLNMQHPNLNLFSSARRIFLHNIYGSFNSDGLENNTELRLYIQNSQLNPLTAASMKGLVGLKWILLSTNVLSYDSDTLNPLVNLEEFHSSANKVKAFPSELFRKNKKLRSIHISEEEVDTLPEEFFSYLPELKDVDIYSCELRTVPQNIFQNSDAIQKVSFMNNKLSSLPAGLFDNLPVLESVNLAGNLFENTLTSLPIDLFANVPMLKAITLSRNRFETVPIAQIKSISGLSIDLSSNQIKDITVEDLAIFEKNTKVNLGRNKISQFSGISYLRQHLYRYNSTLVLDGNTFNCSLCDVHHLLQEQTPRHFENVAQKPFSINLYGIMCFGYNIMLRSLHLTFDGCDLTAPSD
ncbi:carboxypeptidase N subunit 2-like [Bradysia coprophila]|uniref:carboxypeptidase N subunit 2-like n=1 Tax=Bradysia coprophila TaxID=38358 RepID=UPI00187DAA1C|nr:carboxypeptidase N subunit 2-like [Bradysia coprophila]